MKRWICAMILVILFPISGNEFYVGATDEELPGMTEEIGKGV
ncbi:hypothetical protein QT711_19350 [Sporosarcina saromensis]|uniref:Uncharacterized protein n=1 Tax=Sporosarcina saromensis TaxID=359365 RepID=A0ABU4GE99_9BACL|nr:hypothetical protein [Sporosarcina saromensis]MDW0115310.1 hypothetical protein [Sporosarcina saromensis]